LLCGAVFYAASLSGQSVVASRSGVAGGAGAVAPVPATRSTADGRRHSPLLVTLASAVIPGAGQALLGSRRAIPYAAAEAVGWIAYSLEMRDGERHRIEYRDLSRTVARAQFMPDAPGGNWDYYERMEKYARSGVFDAIPGGVVNPEPDFTTYNGSIWLLARQTYWRDPAVNPGASSPEYQAALSFYATRAVPAELRWSWDGSPEGFQRYRRSITSSNESFSRAEQTIGLVIANHVLSVVDAYVSVRLRAAQDAAGRTSLTASVPFGGGR
jgi:hypothetical protein